VSIAHRPTVAAFHARQLLLSQDEAGARVSESAMS